MPTDTLQIAFEAIDKGLSKKVDEIGSALDKLEGRVDTTSESFKNWENVLDKSFGNVGTSAADVSKKLDELGAATTDAAKIQHQLEQAQNDVVVSSQKLAEARKELIRNTDPSKEAELRKEVAAAQVALDNAGESVKRYSDKLNGLNDSADKSKGGFSNLQASIVTVNQGLDLLGRGFNIAKDAVEQTVGATVEYAKQVRDLSTNLGISAEETSKIIQASDDYGISVETITSALQMAVRKGFAPNIETLAKLADEYNNIASPTERAARLTDVFGRNWTALTPLLKEGGQAIRDAATEAERLGLVLNAKDVQDARALEIQLDNLNDKVDALKIQIGKGLIPGLTDAADDFSHLIGIIQGTNTPLGDAARNLERVTKAFGENSEVTAAARAEYERLKKQYDDISMNSGERLLRSNTRLIKTLYDIQGGVSALNQGVRNQADTYAVLDAAMSPVLAKQALLSANQKTLAAIREQNTVFAGAYEIAIQYTESQREQADVQKELDDLNAKIASHGAARVITVKNEKLSTDELAKAQAGLIVAREDLSTAQRKGNETDAEFALRVETIKGKIADYTQKLGEHTAVVGGATKAELEQKTALEGQIAALQKADEVTRAKGAFESLTKSFKDGVITQDQFKERAGALNAITGLYTKSALEQATAQEILMAAFADPRSEAWRSQLILNKEAIDGVVESTKKASTETDTLNKKQAEAPKRAEVKAEKVEIPSAGKSTEAAQAALDFTRANEAAAVAAKKSIEDLSTTQEAASRQMKGNIDQVIGSYNNIPKEIKTTSKIIFIEPEKGIRDAENSFKKITPPVIAPKVDTVQATKDIQSFTTDKISVIPAEKKTTATFDTVSATRNILSLLTLYGLVPKTKDTAVNVDAKFALQNLNDIVRLLGLVRDKTATVTVQYKTSGNPPAGLQSGGSYIVPPNPFGGGGDYFPVLAAPGERVTVQTRAQQNQARTEPRREAGGDTYVYNTNVYNPLAAAMLADQQRRERVARSNARMGVA